MGTTDGAAGMKRALWFLAFYLVGIGVVGVIAFILRYVLV